MPTSLALLLVAAAPLSVEGRWALDEPAGVVVEVRAEGTSLQAVVVAAPVPGFVGTRLLRGVAFDASTQRWVGELYAPRRELWVQATLRVEGEMLRVDASLGTNHRTVRWRRAA